jgi:hypothetical protein
MVLFTDSALLLDSKSVQPQKRTSMSFLKIKHTSQVFFSAYVEHCLTVEKFITPEKYVLLPLIQSKCSIRIKMLYCLYLVK